MNQYPACERCENAPCTCGYLSGEIRVWDVRKQVYVKLLYGDFYKPLLK